MMTDKITLIANTSLSFSERNVDAELFFAEGLLFELNKIIFCVTIEMDKA